VTLLASRALWRAFAFEAWRIGMVPLGIATVLALGFAGFSAVPMGRFETRRARRTLSTLVWGGLLVASLGFAAYSKWVLSPTISSLLEVRDVRPAAVGNWISVSGPSRGRGRDYTPSFLFDAATGRSLHTGSAFGWWTNGVLSTDGRRAAWPTSSSRLTGYGLAWTDLTGQKLAKPIQVNGLFRTVPTCLVLSSDGSRLATIEPAITRMDQIVHLPTLSVFEVPSGRTLLSSRLDSARGWLSFRSNETLRAYVVLPEEPGKSAILEILDVDLKSRKILLRSRIEGVEELLFLAADREGTRLLIHEAHSKRLSLYEAHSGRRLAILGEGPGSGRRASFLSDGRIVLAESLLDFSRRIRIFSEEGRELQTISIEGRGPLNLGGEAAPGRLVVATRPSPSARRTDSTVLLVDISAASTRTLGQNLYPVAASGWWVPGDPSLGSQLGSQATRLFLTQGGGLVSIDFATGARRAILGRKD
jgi:hypothetical protein